MYECEKAAQVAKEMKQYRIDICVVSESRSSTGSDNMVLAGGTTIIYSGRKDGQH